MKINRVKFYKANGNIAVHYILYRDALIRYQPPILKQVHGLYGTELKDSAVFRESVQGLYRHLTSLNGQVP